MIRLHQPGKVALRPPSERARQAAAAANLETVLEIRQFLARQAEGFRRRRRSATARPVKAR